MKEIITKPRVAALNWIADHPNECKHTTKAAVCRAIAKDTGSVETTVYQVLRKLIMARMVFDNPSSAKTMMYRDISVNFMHLDLPKEIREKAPTHMAEARELMEKKLETGEYEALTPEGVGIVKQADPFNEDTEVEEAPAEEDTTLATEPTSVALEETPTPELPPVTVEPQVVKSSDGKTISINLTINLNL